MWDNELTSKAYFTHQNTQLATKQGFAFREPNTMSNGGQVNAKHGLMIAAEAHIIDRAGLDEFYVTNTMITLTLHRRIEMNLETGLFERTVFTGPSCDLS